MPSFEEVDYDPFGDAPKLVPVDHNPFKPEPLTGSFLNKVGTAFGNVGRGLAHTAEQTIGRRGWWYGDQPEPRPAGSTGPIPEVSMTEDPISRSVGAAAEGFKDFVMRPGEVAAGRADPDDIAANLNMALNMTGGAGLIPKGANELRTGVGIRAKGDWFKKLPQFERLEKKGAPPDISYATTGIYRGGDDKLRAWVPDTDSKLWAPDLLLKAPEGASAPMELVWDHPKLYEAYPWLKKAQVNILDNGGRGGGFYDPADGTINVYKSTPERMERTVHHEAVHMIQHFEEFANGGAKEQFLPREFYEKKQQLNDWPIEPGRTITTGELARFRKLQTEVNAMEDEAFRKYLQLHGESEARDAPYMKANPGKVPRYRVPLHVNPDLAPGQDVLVTQPFWRPKRGPVGFVEVDHDPWAGVGINNEIKPRSASNPWETEGLTPAQAALIKGAAQMKGGMDTEAERVWQYSKGNLDKALKDIERQRMFAGRAPDPEKQLAELAEIEKLVREKSTKPFISQAKLDRIAETAQDILDNKGSIAIADLVAKFPKYDTATLQGAIDDLLRRKR